MRKQIFGAVFAAVVAFPLVADAQGVVRGAREGAEAGEDAGGPVGGAVGGVVGGVTGGVAGILGADDGPRFREYAVRERHPSYRWGGGVAVGAELPDEGVTYYDVPPRYHVRRGVRYTIINERPVLVQGRRIVQVLE